MPGRIDDETREEIRNYYKRKGQTYETTARKFGVSLNTVNRIVNESKSSKERKSIKSKPVLESGEKSVTVAKPVIKKSDDIFIINMKTRKNLIVGLVSERHDMPVEKYIFDSVDNKDLFNYDFFDETVRNFIDEKVIISNNEIYNLIVYVTGLTPALAAVMKICAEKEVNLSLRHYDRDTKGYKEQVIYDRFGADESIKSNLATMFSAATDKIIYHEGSSNDIITGTNVFVIKTIRKDPESKVNLGISYDVFNTSEAAHRYFLLLENTLYLNGIDEMISISMEKGNMDKKTAKYVKTKFMLKCANFDVMV